MYYAQEKLISLVILILTSSSPPLIFVEETMFGIKIQDTRPGGGWLSFGLADVLKVIGEPALCSEWRCLNLR